MKNERLLYAIGNIDDSLIENAMKKKRDFHWMKWAAVAACMLVAFCFGNRESSQIIDLPKITIGEIQSANGFEGYWAYSIKELVSDNPWNEELKIDTLPVFKNILVFDENFLVSGEDKDAMKEYLKYVADLFELEFEDTEIQERNTEDFGGPSELVFEKKGISIMVDSSMRAVITFNSVISIPEELKFEYDSSYEEMVAVSEYLLQTYGEKLGIEGYVVDIRGGDYNIYKNQGYEISFYKNSDDSTERILNYNFRQVKFNCNHDGALDRIEIENTLLSEKIGDYPIISVKEAKRLLKNGTYITTVPYEISKMKYVKSVELVYRTGVMEEYYLPYYKFLVELPEEEMENMTTYGAYYVPAVSQDFVIMKQDYSNDMFYKS